MGQKRYRIQRKPLVTTRDIGDERQYVLTEPPPFAPKDATFSTVKIDITRYAERVVAMSDAELDGPGGFGRIVTDEDLAAIQTAAACAAFFTTIYGQAGHAERSKAQALRELVGHLEEFRRFLVAMRQSSERG